MIRNREVIALWGWGLDVNVHDGWFLERVLSLTVGEPKLA